MRQPLRVLIVTPRSPLRHGGVERHVLEVSKRLVAGGARVEVLCAEPGGAAGERFVEGVRIRSVRAWPARRDWCFAPAMWREISTSKWDLVHVQSYHTLVAPLAMLRALVLRLPYCVTFHGGGHSSRLRNRLRTLQLLSLRPLLARAWRLVAVARFEIDHYSDLLRLPRQRFVLIPNGVDPVAAASPDEASEGPPVLASIGRLERYKGHHRVISALPFVLASHPDAQLVIVGNGPYEAQLRRLAGDLGVAEHISFTSAPAGDQEAMGEILSRVSLVVLMSEFETHPLVGLEAAAARRRLLVADRGGLRELAENGIARAVSHDASDQTLAAAIVRELAQPPPAAVPDLPSWDDCAAELLGLYREVASS
jgi:glycosyltransferase involved in cell wall biosynthesis